MRRNLRNRWDPAGEQGFGIIEVLVSALILIMLALGLFTAIDAAGRTSDTNKARSAASSLASRDQERLRGLPITQLAQLDRTDSAAVDDKTYSIRSQGEYVVGTGGTASCASSEEAPRYLKITSTVTWPGMKVNPVKQESLRAIPNRSISGLGSLAVDIDDRSGTGLSGTSVTATGPTTVTGTTNSEGCVIFGFVPAGSYTVTFSRAGYVESQTPNRASVSDTVVVAADAIASAAYQYDRAGAAKVNYVTNPTFGSAAGAAVATSGEGFTIANSLLGTPSFKSFSHTSATSGTSAVVNFPFLTGYEAWAGGCLVNRNAASNGAYIGSLTVPPAGTSSAATVREFRVRIRVRRRNSTSTSSTTNYSTVPAPTGSITAKVIVSPSSSACGTPVAASHISSSGSGASAVSVWEAIVPWGSYTACAQYWATGTSANRGAVTQTLDTNDPNGTTVPSTSAWMTIPYSSTNPISC